MTASRKVEVRIGAAAVGVTAAITAAAVRAQTLDVERPATVVAGTPLRGARTERIDLRQSGLAADPLPTTDLRVAWRAAAGGVLDRPALVGAFGTTYAITTQGDVVALSIDGTERWREATAIAQPGPAALLVDDTVVFPTPSGELFAVRQGGVRWRTHIGKGEKGDAVRPDPLPLPSGGVVVASGRDIVALDADGLERARTSLPEPVSAPLMATLGQVVAVTATGSVWGWVPSAAQPVRLGGFGSSIEGGAALVDRSLVAVATGGGRLTWVDITRRTTTTRSAPGGAAWIGPPAIHGSVALITLLAPSGELAVSFDGSGSELARVLLTPHAPPPLNDGGVILPVGPHTAPIVDAEGTLAFGTADGGVGVVTAGGSLELLSDACSAPSQTPLAPGRSGGGAGAVAGLSPLRPHELLVACRSGTLLVVAGGKPAPPHL